MRIHDYWYSLEHDFISKWFIKVIFLISYNGGKTTFSFEPFMTNVTPKMMHDCVVTNINLHALHCSFSSPWRHYSQMRVYHTQETNNARRKNFEERNVIYVLSCVCMCVCLCLNACVFVNASAWEVILVCLRHLAILWGGIDR